MWPDWGCSNVFPVFYATHAVPCGTENIERGESAVASKASMSSLQLSLLASTVAWYHMKLAIKLAAALLRTEGVIVKHTPIMAC